MPLVASSLAYRMCPAESVICKRDNEGKKHRASLLWAHAACAGRVLLPLPLDLLLSPFNVFPPSLQPYQFLPTPGAGKVRVPLRELLTLIQKTKQPTKRQSTNQPRKIKHPNPTLIPLPPVTLEQRPHLGTLTEPQLLTAFILQAKFINFHSNRDMEKPYGT